MVVFEHSDAPNSMGAISKAPASIFFFLYLLTQRSKAQPLLQYLLSLGGHTYNTLYVPSDPLVSVRLLVRLSVHPSLNQIPELA